jgi:hypothetical protein
LKEHTASIFKIEVSQTKTSKKRTGSDDREDGGSALLQDVGELIPDCTALYPRREYFQSPLEELQMQHCNYFYVPFLHHLNHHRKTALSEP